MNKNINPKIIRTACRLSNASAAAVINLSPLLFITFHDMYGISYTLLGLLVLINFCTQLCIDLTFSFFAHRFNMQKTVRIMPLLTATGLLIYGILPSFFPERAYLFIAVGTLVFSASSGLAEVLISPLTAALPSDNPDREMSLTHSAYAWAVAVSVLFGTVFLKIFGKEYWFVLALIFACLPVITFILFCASDIPELKTEASSRDVTGLFKKPILLLCIALIFLGGASENTMSQWISGFAESALGLPKIWGDVFGTAVFAVMLGLGRSLYARLGKNIMKTIIFGFIGTFICYITAVFSPSPVISLIACAFTGFCVAMLWPGTLILTADIMPDIGVTVYALLAAGGDFGSSAGPQLVGTVTDAVTQNGSRFTLFAGLTAEQTGFRSGMLCAALFPILGIITVLFIKHFKGKEAKS